MLSPPVVHCTRFSHYRHRKLYATMRRKFEKLKIFREIHKCLCLHVLWNAKHSKITKKWNKRKKGKKEKKWKWRNCGPGLSNMYVSVYFSYVSKDLFLIFFGKGSQQRQKTTREKQKERNHSLTTNFQAKIKNFLQKTQTVCKKWIFL